MHLRAQLRALFRPGKARIASVVVVVVLIPLAALGVHALQVCMSYGPCMPTQVGTSTGSGTSSAPPAPPTAGSAHTQHYEYVFPDGEMYVYDMDHGHRLVQHISLPTTAGVRGIVASPVTHMLYVSYGGDGGNNGNGSLLKFDLIANRILWTKQYAHGIDSMAITPDGKSIYLPDGELTNNGNWYVIDAASGAETGTVRGGLGPHNTIVSLNGTHVYLGGRNYNYLEVADTTTNHVIRKIGPLCGGVRPFTINGKQTLAYTTATGFLGFQVSDITTGRVLYTVPVKGFSWDTGGPSAPSHGISLSPNEKELYVMDSPNSRVHVFDVSGVPAVAPRQVADIKVTSMAGSESPCAYDCAKDGWLQHSGDGRFVYVGDSGDVIDTATRTVTTTLPPLSNTRKLLEIDWQNGTPVFTTSRSGLGYVVR